MDKSDQEDQQGPLTLPLDLDGAEDGLPPEERAQLNRDQGLFHLQRIRDEHGLHGTRVPCELREPCRFCGYTSGWRVKVGDQNTVRCGECNKFLYNAPKTETGEVPRTVQTVRREIKPSQQARIFARDNGRCVLCGRTDQPLTVGHLLSVHDGLALGATEAELVHDSNLAAMCEACNLGLGRRSVYPTTYAAIMYRIVQADELRSATPVTSELPAGDSAEPQTRQSLFPSRS